MRRLMELIGLGYDEDYEYDEPEWVEVLELVSFGICIGMVIMGILIKNTYGI